MKQFALITLSIVCAFGAFAQGTINFNTRVTGAGGVIAPVYGPETSEPTRVIRGNATTNGGTAVYTGPLLLGTGFSAALYGGPAGTAAGSLTFIGQVAFRTAATFAGFIQPPTLAPTVPGVAGGSQASFQLRAWNNMNGSVTDWAAALSRGDVAKGTSDVFTPPTALTVPPATPINMVGLTSFNLVVPEPSVIALGVLGLGALLIRRRK